MIEKLANGDTVKLGGHYGMYRAEEGKVFFPDRPPCDPKHPELERCEVHEWVAGHLKASVRQFRESFKRYADALRKP